MSGKRGGESGAVGPKKINYIQVMKINFACVVN